MPSQGSPPSRRTGGAQEFSHAVLTDWAADVERIARSPQSMLHELLILSLLHDEVLIQDEALALSSKLARWSQDGVHSRVLQALLDIGAVKILTHPTPRYPTLELQEESVRSPIEARAKYLQKYATKGEDPFQPTSEQHLFHKQVDSWLLNSPSARRPVDSRPKLRITRAFPAILRQVLSLSQYEKWLYARYRGITQRMVDDFVHYIDDPESAVDLLQERGRDPRIGPDDSGNVVFLRSLGYQLAALYDAPQREAMKRLIQTVFAAPFCRNEDAAGRYGNGLRELVWQERTVNAEEVGSGKLVSVENQIQIPIGLPDLTDFSAEAFDRVRNGTHGKDLRSAVRRMGSDSEFRPQVEAWRAVADDLAGVLLKRHEVTISVNAASIGKRVFWGTFVGALFNITTGASLGGLELLAKAGATGLVSVFGDLLWQLCKSEHIHESVKDSLEMAVQFRCVAVPVPLSLDGEEFALKGGN